MPGSAQKKYSVLPADYTLMGVPLSAGTHDFRVEYSPAGFRYGRWISLTCLVGYLAAVGWWLVRWIRERFSGPPAGNP